MTHVTSQTNVVNIWLCIYPEYESDPEDDSCYKSNECCKHILIDIFPEYESDPEYASMPHVTSQMNVVNMCLCIYPEYESDLEDVSSYKSNECFRHILINIYPEYESDPEYDSCYKSNECCKHMLIYYQLFTLNMSQTLMKTHVTR